MKKPKTIKSPPAGRRVDALVGRRFRVHLGDSEFGSVDFVGDSFGGHIEFNGKIWRCEGAAVSPRIRRVQPGRGMDTVMIRHGKTTTWIQPTNRAVEVTTNGGDVVFTKTGANCGRLSVSE